MRKNEFKSFDEMIQKAKEKNALVSIEIINTAEPIDGAFAD